MASKYMIVANSSQHRAGQLWYTDLVCHSLVNVCSSKAQSHVPQKEAGGGEGVDPRLHHLMKVIQLHCTMAINWWLWRRWEGEVGGEGGRRVGLSV